MSCPYVFGRLGLIWLVRCNRVLAGIFEARHALSETAVDTVGRLPKALRLPPNAVNG